MVFLVLNWPSVLGLSFFTHVPPLLFPLIPFPLSLGITGSDMGEIYAGDADIGCFSLVYLESLHSENYRGFNLSGLKEGLFHFLDISS